MLVSFLHLIPGRFETTKSLTTVYIQCNWVQLTYSCIKEEKCDVTKTPLFGIYAMGWYIQKDQDEKSPLAKNQPVSGNW